jgi:DNA-binding transcriptional LysR family regulator
MSPSSISRLKPSHLRLIRAIHDTGKLQLAADAVGLSQPGASRMLSEIEADIGAPLFERLPRGMQPTPTGAAFVRHARVILFEMDALTTEVTHLRDGMAGAVRVGAVTGPTVGVLVPALLAVRKDVPDIQPTIEVAPSVTLARIGDGSEVRSFQAFPGRTEDVCFLVRASHPLAGRSVSLAETMPYEFVIQESGLPIRTALENAFLANRLNTPRRVTNSSSLLVALSVVMGSEAIAPLTREVAQLLTRTGPGLAILDTQETVTVPPFLVLCPRHRELAPVAQKLLDEVLRRL